MMFICCWTLILNIYLQCIVLWCLTPCLTINKLYRDGQFYHWSYRVFRESEARTAITLKSNISSEPLRGTFLASCNFKWSSFENKNPLLKQHCLYTSPLFWLHPWRMTTGPYHTIIPRQMFCSLIINVNISNQNLPCIWSNKMGRFFRPQFLRLPMYHCETIKTFVIIIYQIINKWLLTFKSVAYVEATASVKNICKKNI